MAAHRPWTYGGSLSSWYHFLKLQRVRSQRALHGLLQRKPCRGCPTRTPHQNHQLYRNRLAHSRCHPVGANGRHCKTSQDYPCAPHRVRRIATSRLFRASRCRYCPRQALQPVAAQNPATAHAPLPATLLIHWKSCTHSLCSSLASPLGNSQRCDRRGCPPP